MLTFEWRGTAYRRPSFNVLSGPLDTMKIFISYAHDDREVASDMANLLESVGVESFLDQKDIHWGEGITARVMTSLTSADATIVVVSPASVKSQWVAFEVGYSMANGNKLLPYLTHPAMDLPGFLGDVLHVSKFENVKKYVAHLKTASMSRESNTMPQGRKLTSSPEQSEKLKYLKEAADDGYIPAMFDYGMEVDDIGEKKRYLKMAADNGYIPAMHEYALLLD